MNKIINLIAFFAVSLSYAQVKIGGVDVTNSSVSLEFGDANKGLVLPYVVSSGDVSDAVSGTLVFDSSDKKVKLYNEGIWEDFSIANDGVVDLTLQNDLNEEISAKTSIGPQSSTKGILVLEDTNKAMILPKVASPHLNIISPAAGMLVYDTVSHMVAFFNGTNWTFWTSKSVKIK